jgi:hypothetical protein
MTLTLTLLADGSQETAMGNSPFVSRLRRIFGWLKRGGLGSNDPGPLGPGSLGSGDASHPGHGHGGHGHGGGGLGGGHGH